MTFKIKISIYLVCLVVFLLPASYVHLSTVNGATFEVYPKESTPLVPYDTWESGTFVAATHGWFVFLKPLPVGDHTVSYSINVVTSGTTAGGSLTTAQYTYHFKVT